MAKRLDTSDTNDDKKTKSQPKTNGTGNEECAHAPIPPDGGWGWVVTFASFIVGVLVDGICFTFGFFLNDFQTYFNSNKSLTSTISSVLNGTYLSLGPIAGALVNRFGCRKVAIAGSIISSISFFLSTFSPNIETMIVLYGMCGGIGFGLTYLPAIVMVGYYFDKKRALATGIAVCGSGIGSFVFAPLSEFLLSTYDWKGAMWVISGLVLNGVVFSCLFRPLEYIEETNVADESDDETLFRQREESAKPHLKELRLLKESPIYRCRSLEACHKTNNNVKELETARLGHSLLFNVETGARKNKIVLNPLARKDIFYSGSIQNLPEFKKAGTEEKFVRSMLSLNDRDGDEAEKKDNVCSAIFKDMFDFSLMKSPTFVLYVFSCFLCMIGFFVPLIYIPDIAQKQGMTSSQTAWVISSIGIVNTVGRLFVGYISDKSWMDSIMLNNVSLIVGGVATMFVPYIQQFGLLLAYALVFGFSIAAFVSLRSIIIVELLGIDQLTNSFGLVILSQGLSTFIGSPIAGALYDLTGDFRASFYLAGSVMTLSGALCIPLRRINRWEQERKQKKNEQQHDNGAEISKMLP